MTFTMTPNLKIGDRLVGPGHRVYVVAELGINHNGSVDLAKDLIKAAAFAGCDAVKLQKRSVEIAYTKEQLARPRTSVYGTTNRDLKQGLEFSVEQYRELSRFARRLNLELFASCWDLDAIDAFMELDPSVIKIASPSLTDDRLLARARATGLPVILSTGMTDERELTHAVEVIGPRGLALLHCVNSYPTPRAEINLSKVTTLRCMFPDVVVGYSGHEEGIFPTIGAVALGAAIIERHLTLSRRLWGTDQAASLEPEEMRTLVDAVRVIEQSLGTGAIEVMPSELEQRDKLRLRT